MIKSCKYFLLLTWIVLSFDCVLFGKEELAATEDKELEPTKLMQGEARWLAEALHRAHYSKVSVEKVDKKEFLKTYMNRLDRQRLYFLESDHEGYLKTFLPTIGTYLEQGNLFPGFRIYNDYKSKALIRLSWVIARLQKDFDLNVDATFVPDREKIPWPKDEKEADEIWEKRLTYEMLAEVLTQIDLGGDENSTEVENKTLLPDAEKLAEFTKEARGRITKRYERWDKNIREFEASDVQEMYLTTLSQMFDPHTTFLNIKERDRFNQSMHNTFVGIGAVLTDEDGFCTIKELLPGGPAEACRELEPEDVILKVAQADGDFVEVVNMKLSKIVELIKGPKDTVVRLFIKPGKNPSDRNTVSITRDRIKLTANLASASIREVPAPEGDRTYPIGVIELPSFYGAAPGEAKAKATDDLEELIGKLKDLGAEGIVLDLRRNGGGFLSEAVSLAGLFISRGPVVQVKSTDGKIRKKFDFNPKIAWEGPLALLVSRYSASAAEIVAGALQNHKRALIIGDKATHGKGTVQSMIEMNAPNLYALKSEKRSAAKITIQKYYLPSGTSTQNVGVIADVPMPSINEFLPIGEADLPHAMKWDEIPGVNYRRPAEEFRIRPEESKQLLETSLKRQREKEEFAYLRKNVDWYKGKRDQKEFSLNLAKRLEQKTKDEDFTKELNEEMTELAAKTFPARQVRLDVVRSQDRRSREVRGEKVEEEGVAEKMEPPTNLDIRLHESLRIVSDWILLREEASKVAKSVEGAEKKS
ncbi:MAG: carboxy terminal-processing peptidase [Verrucomicrobia bacterium]|nr:carboxy terminal-processing peptidase [Verrucomicrobiota bacterium]